MDAIILAAGLGTRLRPHTLTTPKPLLPVQGRPILDWALGALPPVVTRVLVVVNYLAEQIEAYLASQKHLARWEAVRQQEPRGTGDALRSCRERIESDRFLVANGDDLYGAADLAALAACPAGVLVHPVDEPRVSARNEYEITDYVTALAQLGTVHVVPANFWLPIGTIETWQAAQTMDFSPLKG